MKFFLVFCLTLLVSACGGRVSEAVTIERDSDSVLSCDHMRAEHGVNSRRIPELNSERSSQTGNNAGLLLVAPLFMDFSDTEKKEIKALIARNDRLVLLMKGKNCSDIPAGQRETPENEKTVE